MAITDNKWKQDLLYWVRCFEMTPMPGRPYRSKLNEHLDYIREARASGETWKAIAEEIVIRGTATDRSQVCKFFQRKEKGRTPLGFSPEPPTEAGQEHVTDSGLDLPESSKRLVLKVNNYS